MREACKFNVQIHNVNILMSSVTKDPGVSSILLFSGSGINFPRPLYFQSYFSTKLASIKSSIFQIHIGFRFGSGYGKGSCSGSATTKVPVTYCVCLETDTSVTILEEAGYKKNYILIILVFLSKKILQIYKRKLLTCLRDPPSLQLSP